MSIKKTLLFVLTHFMLFTSFLAITQDIQVVGNFDNPPKIYLKNNKPEGILVDILRHVESKSDYKISIELFPWKRAFFLGKNNDKGIIGLSKTNERLKTFDYSDEIFIEEVIMVVTQGNKFPFHSLADLKGKRVGANRGAMYGELFVEGYQNVFTLSEDGSAVQRLNKLLKGRIDVGIFGPGRSAFLKALEVDENLKKRKNEFVVLDKPFNQNATHLGFDKKLNQKKFLKEFNVILAEAKKDGTIERIIKKHIPAVEQPFNPVAFKAR